MANRSNHYEAAFEAYLRAERLPYVAVDEKRRSLEGDASLKNVDFLVTPTAGGLSWLVDVKGRRFPAGVKQRQYWKNWTTRDDIDSLTRWRARFGDGFDAMFVFAYHLTAEASPVPVEQIFLFRDAAYAFVGVPLDQYARAARPLSQRWGTVCMPAAEFRQQARSLHDLLLPAAVG